MGEDGFGVELDAFDFVSAVAQAHDDAVVGFRSDGKLAGQGFPFDNERVIARSGERVGKLAKNIFAVVMDLTGFAMEKLWGTNDFPAEGGANCLVTKANSKNRELPCQPLDEFDRNTRVLRCARAGGNDDALWFATGDFLDGNFVVAMDFDFATEFAEILREVVGKRIVVVQKQNHRYFPNRSRAAASSAVSKAFDLLTLS